MKRHGYGRIINIGSMLSVVAIPERTLYATSKGASLATHAALAIELAQKRSTSMPSFPGRSPRR